MSTRRKRRFLLCVRNRGCDDLELRNLYEQLPDDAVAEEGCVRVLDESGEDYLYPEKFFVAADAPLWLSTFGDSLFVAAFSQRHLADALGEHGAPLASPLPSGATAGRVATDIPSLHLKPAKSRKTEEYRRVICRLDDRLARSHGPCP